MYKLIIEDDEGHTTVVPLVKDEITIGRKEGNTIRLTERNVSRHHARLIKSNGSVFIEDLDSYNGVKVNGDRISARTTIREGDLVEIGDYHFALQWIGEDAAEVPRPLTPTEIGTPPPLAPAQARAAAQADTPAAVMKVPLEQKKEVDTARVRAISEAEAGRLLVLNTELSGSEFTLERTEMVLGRTEDSDVFLNHRSVSNRHAKIVFDGGIYRILDLDSANGVLVNGEEYSRVDLRRGDIIELGHVKIRYIAPGEEFQAISETEVVEDGPTLTAAEPKGAVVGKVAPKKRPGMLLGLIMAVVVVGLGTYYWLTRDQGKTDSVTEDTATTEETAKGPAAEEDPAAKLFKVGVEKLGEREFDAAVVAFNSVLEKNPDYPGAASELARARQEKKNADLLAKARKDLAGKNYNSALDAVSQITTDSVFAKDVAELAPLIRKKYISSHLYKAATFKDNNDLDNAMRHVKAVLVEDEKNESALRMQKTVARMLQARKTVARVSTPPDREASPQPAKKPKKDVAKRNKKKEAKELTTKAKKLVKARKFNEALPVIMRSLRLDPRSCEAHLVAGVAYASLGKRDRAAKYYQKFVDICPRHQRAPEVRNALKAFREYKKDHR